MRRLAGWLFCLTVVPCAVGQEESSPPQEISPIAAEIAQIEQDYQDANAKFYEAYSAAANEDDRQAALDKLYPNADEYAERMLKLIQRDPASASGLKGAAWIVSNSRQGNLIDGALNVVLEEHIEKEEILPLTQSLQYSQPTVTVDEFLRTALEASPYDEVQGHACYALAKMLQQVSEYAAVMGTVPGVRVGNGGGIEALLAEYGDSDELNAEVEELLERVVDEYGDVEDSRRGTLAKRAGADLFEARNLAIGKVAPNIEGTDVDGVDFKLSDYRGKVVMLDFWGDW